MLRCVVVQVCVRREFAGVAVRARGGCVCCACVRGSPVHAGVCKIACVCHSSSTSFGGHVPLDADARSEYLRPMVDLRLMSDHVSSEP